MPVAVEPRPDGRPARSAWLRVARAGDNDRAVHVRLRVGGSAEARRDYLWLATCPGECQPDRLEVVIPAGFSAVEVELLPLADAAVEPDEEVRVSVLPDAAYESTEPHEAVFTLLDATAPNRPPEVLFVTTPRTVYRYKWGESSQSEWVNLLIRARDPDGEVTAVDVFREGVWLGRAERPRPGWPADIYRLWWRPEQPGVQHLTAVATDNQGATTRADWDGLRASFQYQLRLVVERRDPVLFAPAEVTLRLVPDWPAHFVWAEAEYREGPNVLGRQTAPPWEWPVRHLPAGLYYF